MSPEKFSEIARRRLIQCGDVLVPKGHEYSRNGDRLHNFKKAAEIERTTPEKALLGMAMKHIVSIMDMVEDLPDLPGQNTQEEKFTDAINYLLLLEALVEERARRICHIPREDPAGHWPRYEKVVVDEAREQLRREGIL